MKKLKWTLAVVVTVLFSGAVAAQTNEEVTAKFAEAAQLFNEKKFAEAANGFEEVIKMGASVPDAIETVEKAQNYLPKAALNAGMVYAQGNKFDEALPLLLKAKEYGDLYDPATGNRATKTAGNVYMVQGNNEFNGKNFEKAIELYQKGYEIDETNSKLMLNLARSYAGLEQYEKAAETYKALIDLGPTHSTFRADAETAKTELSTNMLAAALTAAQANDMEGVNKYIDLALDGDPENAAASLLRIQAATNAKAYDMVIEYGQAAAEMQTEATDKANVYFFLGSAYENKGNKAKAIESYQKVTTGPNAATAQAQAKALAQ